MICIASGSSFFILGDLSSNHNEVAHGTLKVHTAILTIELANRPHLKSTKNSFELCNYLFIFVNMVQSKRSHYELVLWFSCARGKMRTSRKKTIRTQSSNVVRLIIMNSKQKLNMGDWDWISIPVCISKVTHKIIDID